MRAATVIAVPTLDFLLALLSVGNIRCSLSTMDIGRGSIGGHALSCESGGTALVRRRPARLIAGRTRGLRCSTRVVMGGCVTTGDGGTLLGTVTPLTQSRNM